MTRKIGDSTVQLRKRELKNQAKADHKDLILVHSNERNAVKRDQIYFENYGKWDIHEEMLRDTARIAAYKAAIADSVSGKVAVDVGAGTGVLSLMAAEAGASKVYAIEKSAMVKECKRQIA